MAQDLDIILDLLQEMKRANEADSKSFDKLLLGIESKLEVMDKNVASADLIKAYLSELVKISDEKYSITTSKFEELEHSLRTLLNEHDSFAKVENLRELYDIFSANLNNIYTEAHQNKSILSGIETRILEIGNNKTDKEEILRTIKILRNDFENINHSYKITIDNINADLKNILANAIKSEQSITTGMEQVKIMYNALSDVVNCFNSIDKRDKELEHLLSNVATNENIKIVQGIIDSIFRKTEEIQLKVAVLADKSDIEGLQTTAGLMMKKADELVTKEIFTQITEKTDELSCQTNDIKQTLAKITKDIETLPNIDLLENSLQDLFGKLESLGDDLARANIKDNIRDFEVRIDTLSDELSTIKNIVADINEIASARIIQEIDDISFENECEDIKNHVTNMLSILPQKEDIDKILENSYVSNETLEELVKKTDIIADKIDNMPTHEDMTSLSTNQLSLVENLQEIANKEDIEELTFATEKIEEKIDKLNFDEEFSNIYEKTSNIEKWLDTSKIRENTEGILAQIPDKAEQKDLLEILKATEKIVLGLEELSANVDAKKVNRTVAEVYSMIEELKTDFMNITEMHHDSVIVQLSELQKAITKITTVEDFNNFVEGLKSFVETTVETNSVISEDLEQIKDYEEIILNKLDNIDASLLEDVINRQAIEAGNKLTNLSEYLTNLVTTNKTELLQPINEIIEILKNRKEEFSQYENSNNSSFNLVEEYLKEIRTVLGNSGLSDDLIARLNELENAIIEGRNSNNSLLSNILLKVNEYKAILDKNSNNSKINLENSIQEITEIKEQIGLLSQNFSELNYNQKTLGNNVSVFLSDKLYEIKSDLEGVSTSIETEVQQGFAYNAELIEEKTLAISELIKSLLNSKGENEELYDNLTIADNKLNDFRQELELINTDIISNMNLQTEELVKEIIPIRNMLSNLALTPQNTNLIQEIQSFHNAIENELFESTKFSKSTYHRLENIYEQLTLSFTTAENNLKSFITEDMNSILSKIDNLQTQFEEIINRLTPPQAKEMSEFRVFQDEIEEFKQKQSELILDAVEDIKSNITNTFTQQHEELKSILTVAINNKEIVNAIEDLKESFIARIQELKDTQNSNNIQENNDDEFSNNQFEQVFETNKNIKIIEDLKSEFNKFTETITSLSDKNPEIVDVLDSIKSKMESISVAVSQDYEPEIIEENSDNLNDETNTDICENKEEINPDTLVGINNFDIIKALDLLKLDIQNLHKEVENIIPKEDKNEALEQKIEQLSVAINKDWLEEIKTYIAGSEIQTILEEISEKINVLTLSENSEWVEDIKQSLNELNSIGLMSLKNSNKQIQQTLDLIVEKISIINNLNNSADIEDIKASLAKLETSNSENLLTELNEKVDKLSVADNSAELEEIKTLIENFETPKTDALLSELNEKFDKLSVADNSAELEEIKTLIENFEAPKTDALLSELNEKFDKLSVADNSAEFEEIKTLIENFETPKTDALLSELSEKVDKLSENDSSADIEEIKFSLAKYEDDTAEHLLNLINEKIDIIASTDNTDDFEDIKYSLFDMDEKFEDIQKLSEADARITGMLETLNKKIDLISQEGISESKQAIEDVKHLISAQTNYIERLEKNGKTEAVRKCLQELTIEVNNLNKIDSINQLKKTLKEMKESIMSAVVTIFDQVSFIEEAEDIKDFVEERTDEINQNLVNVTNQLKQITSSEDNDDYTYSMQDIESDLAKIRLALSETKTLEQEAQTEHLSYILNNINQISSAVEELHSSLPTKGTFELSDKFEKINKDIMNLNATTIQLIQRSGESYLALNSGIEGFEKVLTEQLGSKVDKVTEMLKKSYASDNVMRQALIYMGEWIDTTSESLNKISTNSNEIFEVKNTINTIKSILPEQTSLLNSLEEKFEEQHQRLKFFEKQMVKLSNLENQFEQQQDRIDRLEIALDKVLTVVEDLDDSKVSRKIDKIDKQLSKLSSNIEKLTSYVD